VGKGASCYIRKASSIMNEREKEKKKRKEIVGGSKDASEPKPNEAYASLFLKENQMELLFFFFFLPFSFFPPCMFLRTNISTLNYYIFIFLFLFFLEKKRQDISLVLIIYIKHLGCAETDISLVVILFAFGGKGGVWGKGKLEIIWVGAIQQR
jgi:cellulose synthase/poly-beta-1,6-N-acetylglucosamine synthase-like glycosyltransferase